MKNLDTLYEAYQNYKKLCIVDNDTPRFLRSYMNNKDRESEDIVTVFSVCHIEQDWVEAIEVGLPFIEKAIKEERQFIRNDGEVLPIEKIRKTSKDSIQDLAKHANYITHEAPDDLETEVLPDKMLMIQKESDFAIYENRVLYAALMYLKDFVASRLVEIKETTNTYIVKQPINKLIDMGSRKVKVDLKFDESRVNDPLLTENNHEKDVIDRLDEILTGILALLKTPLMREVSKAEMVSRPIAKTNILKMNRNFRESLACFEYIANYQGKGFTIEHIEKSLIPYTKAMNEAYTENLIMLSFINYMFANNITDELKADFEEILAKREQQKQNEILAKLRDFHSTAEMKEQTINEFLIAFEQGYRILESRNDELELAVKDNEARRVKELKEIQEQHEDFVDDLNKKHQEELNNLNKETNDKLDEMTRQNDQKIIAIEHDKQDQIAEAKDKAAKDLADFKDQFKNHIAQMEKENAEIKAQEQDRKEKIATLEAQLLQRQIEKGEKAPIDFADEDSFNHLEELKNNLDSFFEKAWKEAKKKIRKDVLLAKRTKKGKKGEEPEIEPVTEEPIPVPPLNEQPKEEEPIKEEPIPEEAPVMEEPVNEEPINEEPAPQEVVEEQPLEETQPVEQEEETPFEEPINEENIEPESPMDNEEVIDESNDEVVEEKNTDDLPMEEESINEESIPEESEESVVEDSESNDEENKEDVSE